MAQDVSSYVPQVLAMGLDALRNNLPILRYINTSFQEATDFANQGGDTIDVPIPSDVAANDVTPASYAPATQELGTGKAQIPVNFWKEVPWRVTDRELAKLAAGFMPTQLSECIATLSREFAMHLMKAYVHSYGTIGGSTNIAFHDGANTLAAQGRARLTKQLAPAVNRFAIVSPDVTVNMAGVSTFSQANTSGDPEVVARGAILRGHGFFWEEDQRMPIHETGTAGGTGADTVVNGAHLVGVSSINATVGATNAMDLKVGDVITFAGHSQQYVLTAAAAASATAAATLAIAPKLKVALAGAEAITCFSDGTDYEVNIMAHRDAFAAAFIRTDMNTLLSKFGITSTSVGVDETLVDLETGLALRFILKPEHYQVRTALSILAGTGMPRPALACRLASKVVA